MARKRRRIKKRGKNRHLLLVLFLIVVAVFFYFEESGKENVKRRPDTVKTPQRAETAPDEAGTPHEPLPGLPMVSIVMDDLGPNKKHAEEVFALNAPVTLSILPHETYSRWIAEEGKRQGHQIIAHIPMEAMTPQRLGKGGLTRGMTGDEISRTLKDDLLSIPYISGASNHMGSAFTKDERAMRAVITELKELDLFFLDSLTTADSVAYKTALDMRLPALKRDVFLDNADNLREIEVQWKRLLKIADKQGHAIALAHPRDNTLRFLNQVLQKSNGIRIVPLEELLSK